ncbi:MAG: hypothetical protein WCF85_15270 [Rhodospirillaceae bacterium]
MKRFLPVLVMLSVFALPIGNAKADSLIGNATVACAIGAGAMGLATYTGWVPALVSGIVLVPFSEIIAVNALIGCGIGFVGTVSTTLIGRAIDPNLVVTK